MSHFRQPLHRPVARGLDASEQYRREAMRLRKLADVSVSAAVKHDLADIAREYEALADQRDHLTQRYGAVELAAPARRRRR